MSPNDYHVSKEALWLDGFKESFPFVITGPMPVICHISTVHGKHPDIIKINSGELLENIFSLNKYCRLLSLIPGNYNIKFISKSNLYTEDNKNAHYTFEEDKIKEYIELIADSNFTLTGDSEKKIITGDFMSQSIDDF